MDVKSAFLYEKIKEVVYVCQPLGFEDLDFPDRVYKVEKALFTEVKTTSTPIETQKPLFKDEDGEEVDVYMYRSMMVPVRNFTYIVDFMIIEDITSIIDPRMSQVVLGKPFVEISNMTHEPPKGVVRFTNGNNEVAYKMPHKMEQYDSLSNLEKEHTKSVYLRNEEDKKRGVEYVMSKILGFYKECLELGPEYLTGMDDEGEVT
ncbi:retrotransposon ORF1 [Tanacetum coccineum]